MVALGFSTIHTQADSLCLDEAGKRVTRQLTALIRIHDVWSSLEFPDTSEKPLGLALVPWTLSLV